MKRDAGIVLAAVIALVFAMPGTSAAEIQYSGFFGNPSVYDLLKPGPEGGAKLRWIKAGVDPKKYDTFMVDSVIFYLADQSDYKGIDPQEMKELADAFNKEIVAAFKDKYPIVADPGPTVARLRIAITNIKQSRPGISAVTSIIPVGLGISLVKKGATGGWSGSALNVKVSDNDGRDWGPARRLVTSPLLNMGTLVRCGAVRFRDGSFGLPVYHELFGKYGSLLVLDPGGRPIDERRISWGRSSLQPCVVPLDASRAIAFLRQSGMADRRVLLSRSFDGGKSWSPAEKLPLPNPDSAVSAVAADDETLLLACNTLEYDRDTLGLIRSRDVGRRWEMLHDFTAEGAEEAGLSYPFLIEAGDGIFHLLYSWNRERIGHVRFNRAWMGTPR